MTIMKYFKDKNIFKWKISILAENFLLRPQQQNLKFFPEMYFPFFSRGMFSKYLNWENSQINIAWVAVELEIKLHRAWETKNNWKPN